VPTPLYVLPDRDATRPRRTAIHVDPQRADRTAVE
jgi:hypothetical protein